MIDFVHQTHCIFNVNLFLSDDEMSFDEDPVTQLPGATVSRRVPTVLTRAYGSWMSFTSLETARREVYAFARVRATVAVISAVTKTIRLPRRAALE